MSKMDNRQTGEKSFWEKPWREVDYIGEWLSFGLFVVVASIIGGIIFIAH